MASTCRLKAVSDQIGLNRKLVFRSLRRCTIPSGRLLFLDCSTRASMAHREAVRGVHTIRLTRFGVCGLMRWRFSDGELMPFSERRRSVLLEDVAAIEVAVLIEVIMDRGVNGGKLL